jgi:hypothetical protein
LDSVRNLLWKHHPAAVSGPPPVLPVPSLIPETELSEDDDPVWPSARIGVVEALWGEGFLFPGGREETLRLAKPLGLSDASSLLLLARVSLLDDQDRRERCFSVAGVAKVGTTGRRVMSSIERRWRAPWAAAEPAG